MDGIASEQICLEIELPSKFLETDPSAKSQYNSRSAVCG